MNAIMDALENTANLFREGFRTVWEDFSTLKQFYEFIIFGAGAICAALIAIGGIVGIVFCLWFSITVAFAEDLPADPDWKGPGSGCFFDFGTAKCSEKEFFCKPAPSANYSYYGSALGKSCEYQINLEMENALLEFNVALSEASERGAKRELIACKRKHQTRPGFNRHGRN